MQSLNVLLAFLDSEVTLKKDFSIWLEFFEIHTPGSSVFNIFLVLQIV